MGRLIVNHRVLVIRGTEYALNYSHPNGQHLLLEGKLQADLLSVRLRKVDPSTFLLLPLIFSVLGLALLALELWAARLNRRTSRTLSKRVRVAYTTSTSVIGFLLVIASFYPEYHVRSNLRMFGVPFVYAVCNLSGDTGSTTPDFCPCQHSSATEPWRSCCLN